MPLDRGRVAPRPAESGEAAPDPRTRCASRPRSPSALDYAHRHNVIHRDIKPENVLLHDGRALVADFGIALAASKAGGSRMTETGMSLGTPTYMSPEQAMGEREITARSDIYALGAMTYEMLLGEPPFTGPTAQSIVAKVMTEKAGAAQSPRRDRRSPQVEDAVLTACWRNCFGRSLLGLRPSFAAALNGDGAKGRERLPRSARDPGSAAEPPSTAVPSRWPSPRWPQCSSPSAVSTKAGAAGDPAF